MIYNRLRINNTVEDNITDYIILSTTVINNNNSLLHEKKN